MNGIRCAVIAAAIAVAALSVGQRVQTQGGELAAGKVNHVGVVVPDVDAALREYVRVMGFTRPKVSEYPIPLPDGKTTRFKNAVLYMPNFFIELIQPVSENGPYYEHLKAQGASIEHMGLYVPGQGSIDDVRAALEQAGGKWVLGNKGANYAYVDFHSRIGTTLEVNRGATGAPGEPPMTPPTGDALPPLGALPVTHVGFAATDTAAVVSSLAKIIGITAPKVMEYKDAQYPPSSNWSTSAFLRLAMFTNVGTGVEVIESVGGPTPWSEYVKQQKGTAAQHVAINVGNRMDEEIKDLQAKGGKWTNGKPGGNYAYLDFTNTLGLVFELNGTSKSAGK
jgi:prepilin-type processing-associated H-X9-DG protein